MKFNGLLCPTPPDLMTLFSYAFKYRVNNNRYDCVTHCNFLLGFQISRKMNLSQYLKCTCKFLQNVVPHMNKDICRLKEHQEFLTTMEISVISDLWKSMGVIFLEFLL